MKKLSCDICGSTDVGLSIHSKEPNGNYITFSEEDDNFIEDYRLNFTGSMNSIINKIKNNINNYNFLAGCGNCEDECDLLYNGVLTDNKDIFLAIVKLQK